MKVEQFYNKNQFIIYGGDALYTFQSYNSIIAQIKEDGTLVLGFDWDYSNTTLRHLYLFIDEFYRFTNNYTQNLFSEFKKLKNKKQFIQNLIDKDMIKINVNLENIRL